MPYGFRYLATFLNDTNVTLLPQMKLYLSLALQMILAFGLTFELPIVLVFLVRWGIVSLATLKSHRRHMIFFAFIFGALITPPDVISQISVAIPFILLYEVGLFIASFTAKRQEVPT